MRLLFISAKLFFLCACITSCSTMNKQDISSSKNTTTYYDGFDCVQVDKLVRSPASGNLCKDLFYSGSNNSPQDFLNSFSQNSPQGEAILKRTTFKPKKVKALGGKDVYVDNLGAYLVEQTLYIIREFAMQVAVKNGDKPDLSYNSAQEGLNSMRARINLADLDIKADPLSYLIAKKFIENNVLKPDSQVINFDESAVFNILNISSVNDTMFSPQQRLSFEQTEVKIRTFVSKEIAKVLVLEKSYKPKDIVGFDGKKITSATYAEFVFEQSKFLFRDFLGDYLAGIIPPQDPRLPAAQTLFITRFKDTTVNPVAYRFAYSRLMQLHESVISGKLKEEDLRKLDVAVFDSMLWTDILRLSSFQRP